MKKTFLLFLMAFMSLTAFSNKTFPLKGTFVSPAEVSLTQSAQPGTILVCRSLQPSRVRH